MAHFAGASADDEFWTACPHCCYVHSYPRLYVARRLLCPTATCRRVFSADELPSPPPIVSGTDMYFCTWAFFPLGPPAVAQGWAPFNPFNPAPPPSPSPTPNPTAATATPASAIPSRVRPTSRKKVGVCLKGRARVEAEEEEQEEELVEEEKTSTVANLKADEEVQMDWLSLGSNGDSGININESVDLSELGFRIDETGFLQELP